MFHWGSLPSAGILSLAFACWFLVVSSSCVIGVTVGEHLPDPRFPNHVAVRLYDGSCGFVSLYFCMLHGRSIVRAIFLRFCSLFAIFVAIYLLFLYSLLPVSYVPVHL
jgi:hypothetical protein